ncbi:hypothetical protein PILCRDRAFT_590938 [Piloderma croceum F 1598]|uniref:Uncharacterized protein n=1 Tax=Piloderma croceum (strain F 1598) TaxID=765440 RepID=A0A0C3BMG0_PILCF|nr:hypothetical protein PILCRDRAFT_590938 [Piloderma croceum F 1598]
MTNSPLRDSRSCNTLPLHTIRLILRSCKIRNQKQTVGVLVSLIFWLCIRVRLVGVSSGRG